MNFKTKEMCYCALMACMMAIFSQIKIDLLGYVPITLQTFMVCLIALIAPCKVAVSACVVYLLMGAVGLPVLLDFKVVWIALGYSGGYIFSFPIMVYVISN
ncbi:MAG: biotin transporter BioY [Faecalibacillus faecis]